MYTLAATALSVLLSVSSVGGFRTTGSPSLPQSDRDAAQRAFDTGHYAEAEARFEQLFRELSATKPATSELAECANSLANVYVAEAKYGPAEQLYRRALEISEQQPKGDLDVAITLGNLGVVLRHQARYRESEIAHQRSLELFRKTVGEGSEYGADALYNLGELYSAEERFADAEPLYRKAAAIREKLLGPNDPETAVTWSGLGKTYQARGNFAAAREMFESALRVAERNLASSRSAGVLMNSLAGVDIAQGRYKDARKLLERSRALLEAALGPKHPELGAVYSNLGLLEAGEHRYRQAADVDRRALAIHESSLGPNHPTVAVILNNLGVAMLSLHRYADAESDLLRAKSILEAAPAPGGRHLGDLLGNLGNLYGSEGRNQEAIPYYRRALATLEATFGPNSPRLIPWLNSYAIVLRRTEDYAEAEQAETQALGIQVRNALRR